MRINKCSLLIASFLLLAGCEDKQTESGPVIKDSTTITSTTWNSDVDKMIEYTCGDAASLFPHLNGTSYYTYIETVDGTKCTIMNVYMDSLSDVIDDYEVTLENAGFMVASDYYYSYHIFEEVKDAVVQYSEAQDERAHYYIELIFYTAQTRYKTFDNEFVETVLGTTLPVPEASSYSAYFDGYTMMGSIYANNVALDGFTKYHQALINTGKFVLKQNTAYASTYASTDGYLYVDISPAYDEYNREAILIRFSNNWPRVEIMSYLGGLDLPKFKDTYTDGDIDSFYLDINQDGAEDVFEIVFDNVTEVEYESYKQKYNSSGWILDDSSSSTSAWYSKTISVSGASTTYEVGVLLGQFDGYPFKSIAVVIYL